MLLSFDIWKMLAGLGIFIFGMFLLEDSIRKVSGRAFKKMIREYTSGRIKAIFSGLFITSILQSSSAVSLMILAFVGAGIMSMKSAIGVLLGSNIGTTVTGWIVATIGFKLNIESFALPIIGIGGIGMIFLGKYERYSNLSTGLLGFGFLFLGLDYMKTSVESFTENFDINTIPQYGIVVYLLTGILLTALMQSSSATMAVILTALNANILDFNAAAAMVIGANVGTTVTILLGAIGGSLIKKRVAFSHFVFNLVTGITAIVFMPLLTYFVLSIFDAAQDAVLALALFHTVFNVIGVAVFFPFITPLTKILSRLFPEIKADLTLFINNTDPDVAEAGISAMRSETMHLLKNVMRHNLNILNIDQKLVFAEHDPGKSGKKSNTPSQPEKYENLKLLQAEIFKYSTSIQVKELTEAESVELNRYLHGARIILHAAKTLRDIKHNFDDFESADSDFLNDQYIQFRKRLIETYFKIDRLINVEEEKGINKSKSILKELKKLREADKRFVEQTTEAIKNEEIGDLYVSTALLVNRAFVQSERQILIALKELILDAEEFIKFESYYDESIVEYE